MTSTFASLSSSSDIQAECRGNIVQQAKRHSSGFQYWLSLVHAAAFVLYNESCCLSPTITDVKIMFS